MTILNNISNASAIATETSATLTTPVRHNPRAVPVPLSNPTVTPGSASAKTVPQVAISSYAVGYAKPPLKTRFQKGQSGNAKGRPKGSPNLATLFRSESETKVAFTENGKERHATKRQIIVKTLVNKAAKGDAKAVVTYLKLDEAFNPPAPENLKVGLLERKRLAEEDKEILAYLGLSLASEAEDTTKIKNPS